MTRSSSPTWMPLLSGADADRARTIIDGIRSELAETARARRPAHRHAYRVAEQALLEGYAAESGLQAGKGSCDFLLEEVVEAVPHSELVPGLYGGLAGVGWIIEHVARLDGGGPTEVNDPIDEALNDCVLQGSDADSYDLIGGAVGLGVYALERLPASGAVELVGAIRRRLLDTVRWVGNLATWLTPPGAILGAESRARHPNGYYNLGLAHGVPGAAALLGSLGTMTEADSEVEMTVSGALEWISANSRRGAEAWFPYWVSRGDRVTTGQRTNERLGWCYGDLGVGAALHLAGKQIGSERWMRDGVEIMKHTLERPMDATGVVDASLCHGAAGIAHVYNRVYQTTGDMELRSGARRWFERTFELHRPGTGFGGFSFWGQSSSWESDPSFLTGAVGIALALLAGISDKEPGWDRLLLISAK
jgi:lantibiotic modifying enzyme